MRSRKPKNTHERSRARTYGHKHRLAPMHKDTARMHGHDQAIQCTPSRPASRHPEGPPCRPSAQRFDQRMAVAVTGPDCYGGRCRGGSRYAPGMSARRRRCTLWRSPCSPQPSACATGTPPNGRICASCRFLRMRDCLCARTCVFVCACVYAYACLCASVRASVRASFLPARRCSEIEDRRQRCSVHTAIMSICGLCVHAFARACVLCCVCVCARACVIWCATSKIRASSMV